MCTADKLPWHLLSSYTGTEVPPGASGLDAGRMNCVRRQRPEWPEPGTDEVLQVPGDMEEALLSIGIGVPGGSSDLVRGQTILRCRSYPIISCSGRHPVGRNVSHPLFLLRLDMAASAPGLGHYPAITCSWRGQLAYQPQVVRRPGSDETP